MTASTQQCRALVVQGAPNQQPAVVRVGQLALMAGLAGYPLIVAYEDLPASLLEELWDYYIQQLPSDYVVYVLRAADLDQLDSCEDSVRLVLVYDGRLLAQVDYRLRVGRKRAGHLKSEGPTIFARGVVGAMDDLPSPALAIPGSVVDIANLATWLRRREQKPPLLPIAKNAIGCVQFPHQLETALWPAPVGCDGPSLTQCDVVRSLLAAAAVERMVAAGEGAPAPYVTGEDYTAVLGLLAQVSARSLEQLNDPMAMAMVVRANLYLRLRTMAGRIARPARLDAQQPGPLMLPVTDVPRVITRKELADLGDTRSRAFRSLVEYVTTLPVNELLKACHSLGLLQPGRLTGIPVGAITAPWLERNMVRWSPKQVLTHFHPLHKLQLIDAHRTTANGPWEYEVPDEMSVANPLTRRFPKADDLWPRSATKPGTSLVSLGGPA